MKVTLFNPPVHHYSGVWYRMNPTLGLPILAAVMERAGHEASVWDLEALQYTPAMLAESFVGQRDKWPDAIGFTVTTHNARGARECIAALRSAGYNGYVMVGGPHITLLAREGDIPDGLWGADVWVAGECEGNILDVVERRQYGVIQGQPAPIESIPAPLWAKHHPSPIEYGGNMPKIGHPEGIAMWSRGCPGACSFCGSPVFGRQAMRTRPVSRVYEDMAALKGLGVQSVFVYDDELVGLPKHHAWLEDVCQVIAPLGLTWKAQGRCTVNTQPSTLEAMHAAGCRAIMWGVESLSQPILDAMKKGTRLDDITTTLERSHAAGIGNWLFLMIGNYGETAAHLAETERRLIELARAGFVQWRQVTVCTPVRGTPLYETAKAEGWLIEPPEGGPQMAQVYNATPWLKQREMRYWKARLERAGQ